METLKTWFVRTFERYPFWMAVVVASVVLLGACAASAETRKVHLDAGDIDRVDIEINAGEIRLAGAEGGAVNALMEDIDVCDRCEVRMVREGRVLVIEAKLEGHSRQDDCEVSLELSAPPTVAIDAGIGAGDVTLDELGSNLRLFLGAGDIRGQAGGDRLQITSGAGDIRLTGLAAPAVVETGAGTVELTFRHVPEGTIRTSAGIGDVTVVLPEGIAVDTEVSAGLGSIHQGLADTPDAATVVRATTGVGTVSIDHD